MNMTDNTLHTSVKSKDNSVAREQILNCETKDETGLNDFQKLPSEDQIPIPSVGVNRFRIPLKFHHKNENTVMSHDTHATLFINLKKEKTGINMSRLCSILNEQSLDEVVDYNFNKKLIDLYQEKLRDYPDEKFLEKVQVKFEFNFPLKQKSLKSDNWGWQYYTCVLESIMTGGNDLKHFISVHYEYSSTCPCSLSMSKQYEKAWERGEIKDGNGIATAHSQRSGALTKVELTKQAVAEGFFIEDLVDLLRIALPTETQSLVKRADEQAFAILNGANPMFVEHASKRVYKTLNASNMIADWAVNIEHWESLHSHNAASIIYKGIDGGLTRAD